MLQTYEAVLQPNRQLQFFDLPQGLLQVPRRILVTFTQQVMLAADTALCGAALSEPALAQNWLRDEEGAGWAHLKQSDSDPIFL